MLVFVFSPCWHRAFRVSGWAVDAVGGKDRSLGGSWRAFVLGVYANPVLTLLKDQGTPFWFARGRSPFFPCANCLFLDCPSSLPLSSAIVTPPPATPIPGRHGAAGVNVFRISSVLPLPAGL